MHSRRWAICLALAVLMMSGCSEHFERITVTAPQAGAVVTLTNGSGTTLKEAKIRVLNVAGYEEAWRDIANLSKGETVPIDLTHAIENAHKRNVPPGIAITLQMSQAHQAPQLKSWDFKEDDRPGASIRITAFSTPIKNVAH